MVDLQFKAPMDSVQIRLPHNIREKAKALAEQESGPDRKVSESAVYRAIIENFFDEMTTECSHKQKQSVGGKPEDVRKSA